MTVSKSRDQPARSSNLIFDHISIEFAQWNNIDASNKNATMTNITVQYSINANPTGQQFRGTHRQTDGLFTWYGNLWANARSHAPGQVATPSSSTTWSTTTNALLRRGHQRRVLHDLINNYFIAGPSTNSVGNYFYQLNAGQTFYVSGNLADTNKDAH